VPLSPNTDPRLPVLRGIWRACFAEISLEPPYDVFETLIRYYAEPHRAYHTLQHIAECFLQLAHAHREPSPAVRLALWFHDAIYDPRRAGNEEESAAYARRVLLAAGAGNETAASVENMIMATRHEALPATPEEALVVDIDLSILGAKQERFLQYEDQIREEYGWVEEGAFRKARVATLKSFLDRPFIYTTPRLRADLEPRARANLALSIDRLASGEDD
jgi:predicted metal-dependent HD superfamily phosphohydrolase